MEFLPAGFAGDNFNRRLQILDAAGDVGIAGGTPRLAVIFVIHGPAVEAIAGEFIHDRIFAMAGNIEVEYPRAAEGAVNAEQPSPGRLAAFARATPVPRHS